MLLAEIPLLLRLAPGKRRAQAIERRRLQLQRWNDWDHELAFEKDACIVEPQSATTPQKGHALCVRFSSAECLVEATARGNTTEGEVPFLGSFGFQNFRISFLTSKEIYGSQEYTSDVI